MYVEKIYKSNTSKLEAYKKLLTEADLAYEEGADYLLGLFDDERELLAGASVHGNTLRGLVAKEDRQGEGLISQLISAIIQEQASRGIFRLFLYGKLEYLRLYRNLGFYPLAEAGSRMVFMENSKEAFSQYLAELVKETEAYLEQKELGSREQFLKPSAAEANGLSRGAIVMNANPCTLGHEALINYALANCDLLHLFILEDDVSEFSYSDRRMMLERVIADKTGVVLHGSSSYIISQASFPNYFLKSLTDSALMQAEIDAEIFCKISQQLGISKRFLGTEPYSELTASYNEVLTRVLTKHGIKVELMPRKVTPAGEAISASKVRQLIEKGRIEEALALIPEINRSYMRKILSK